MVMRFMDDARIRGFIKEHGNLIEDGDFETYSVDEIHLGHISRVLQDIRASQSGLGALPTCFWSTLLARTTYFCPS
jgi:hypothetical protein